jgi:hypothetical protein
MNWIKVEYQTAKAIVEEYESQLWDKLERDAVNKSDRYRLFTDDIISKSFTIHPSQEVLDELKNYTWNEGKFIYGIDFGLPDDKSSIVKINTENGEISTVTRAAK